MRFDLDAVIGWTGEKWRMPGFDLPGLEKDGLALFAEDIGAGERSHLDRLSAYGWITNQVSIRAAPWPAAGSTVSDADRTPRPRAGVHHRRFGRTGSTLLQLAAVRAIRRFARPCAGSSGGFCA